ncbi:NEDD4-binding protein 3-A [Hoplias malabaricus]|uniref:NEDD4-binding protein 3-A n=1 Tax=Hoplias malabaricus TaxID=27720 RepID=UPI003461CA4F
MATVQTLPLSRDASKSIGSLYPASSLVSADCIMGSVGSLIENAEISPTKANRAAPQGPERQSNGLLRKGFNQRELLNYLNITKKEPRGGKHIISGTSSVKREHSSEEENVYAKVYHKDGREVDVGKNSLPIGGKFDKPRLRPSAFKPVTPKNFSSVQNLYQSKPEELTSSVRAASKSLSTSSSSSSPSRGATSVSKGVLATPRALSQEAEETASDSGHNSLTSLPPYRPPGRPHLGHISASTGHIDHIGALERPSGRSTATLGRLQGRATEAPPPYQLSLSMEEVVKELEERLQEKEHELRHIRRNLDESEDAIAQVFEGKQRLWEKEVEELKQLYSTKLRQVSQQAQRSQRSLQLQLFKAQQERSRLQDELQRLKLECLKNRGAAAESQQPNPQLEETQWEVCQKTGEISLLKQQLRDSQAEVTQKLSEIFLLKTELREARGELKSREGQIELLQLALQTERRRGATYEEPESKAAPGATEERLRAELLLERRQSEAQTSAFDLERSTWQQEKDKVIRYQRELQASYLDMVRKNQSLERELRMLRAGDGATDVGGAPEEEERPPSSLPWIERIESSEI